MKKKKLFPKKGATLSRLTNPSPSQINMDSTLWRAGSSAKRLKLSAQVEHKSSRRRFKGPRVGAELKSSIPKKSTGHSENALKTCYLEFFQRFSTIYNNLNSAPACAKRLGRKEQRHLVSNLQRVDETLFSTTVPPPHQLLWEERQLAGWFYYLYHMIQRWRGSSADSSRLSLMARTTKEYISLHTSFVDTVSPVHRIVQSRFPIMWVTRLLDTGYSAYPELFSKHQGPTLVTHLPCNEPIS